MGFIEAPTNFYLGRTFDPSTNHLGDDVVYYDSRDLVTHAVVVGMTGSGKTGLCINLLEEAILDNIPAIIIDPKGDITNLLLTFPGLQPQDFQPWIHPDDARRAGMDIPSFSADVAHRWRAGLEKWGIVPDRLTWLKHAAKYSIYTPGSDAGLPISILASLRAPQGGWAGNEESIREKITGVTTALLALAGINAEPVKDKEHVLISNIFEWSWRQGIDLTLEDIILQIKQPPFDKLGVFQIDQYMSEKERFKLAMEMNNIIASPSFQSWIQGEPMDIQRLLYQPNGRPKVSIFYTAHLNDAERMFIMTLLLESMLSWMRTLSGTTSLRALLYIDEMFGYFPPYPKNPPTKEPLMRLLKQARAFGIGLIMATQNPGDLDYKGLTNTGTWFIGRLQSENDRKKVMAGLQALASADEDLNMNDVSQLIGEIQPRVFLMRNVHNQGGPILVHTRWAMNYLAGPLTRQQIGQLMAGQRQELMQQIAASYYGAPGQNRQQQIQQYYQQQQSPYGYQTPGGGQTVAPPPTLPGQQGVYPPPPPSLPGQQGGYGAQSVPNQGGYNPPMPPIPGQQPGFGAQSVPNQGGYNPPMPPVPGQQSGFGAQSVPNQSGFNTPVPGQPAYGAQATNSPQTSSGNAPQGYSDKRPAISSSIAQYFLPTTMTSQQALGNWQQQTGYRAQGMGGEILAYQPILFAQTRVQFTEQKAQVYLTRNYAFHVPDLTRAGFVNWEEYLAPVVERGQLSGTPFGQAIFGELSPGLLDSSRMSALKKELVDMLYSTARIIVPFHPQFKLYGHPDKDLSDFQAQVYQQAREQRDAEVDKLSAKYGKMMDALDDKLRRKSRELEAEKLEIRDRKREQLYTTGEAVLSIFKGRTNYTLSRMSRATRMKRQTEADLQESHDVLDEIQDEMMKVEQDYEDRLKAIDDKWGKIANDVSEHVITPFKKDINVEMFGIGWIPHYYVTINGQPTLLSAFQ